MWVEQSCAKNLENETLLSHLQMVYDHLLSVGLDVSLGIRRLGSLQMNKIKCF